MHQKLLEVVASRVFNAPSSDKLFNQYRDADPALDIPNAPQTRRSNLLNYLAACPDRPDLLIVAEAPGPHGCRFTGVPFTSEEQLMSDALPFPGCFVDLDTVSLRFRVKPMDLAVHFAPPPDRLGAFFLLTSG